MDDMSGQEDGNNLPRLHEFQNGSIRLRACEPCRSRKVKCDHLDPCSACKAANIACRTALRPVYPKRQRAPPSSRNDEQLDKINFQLSQLQASVDALNSRNCGVASSTSPGSSARSYLPKPTVKPVPTSRSSNDQAEAQYHGGSSFEAHSQQAGQVFNDILHQNSSASFVNQDVPSIKDTVKSDNSRVDKLIKDLPLLPVTTALSILKLVDLFAHGFFSCVPMIEMPQFKTICQKVYFPLTGYTVSDFVIVNGGLLSILSRATNAELKSCGIEPKDAVDAFALCERNVMAVIDNLGLFVEATLANIRILLLGAYLALMQSDPHRGWRLISIACRLCLDAGFNRLKDSADDPEINEKKYCFWFCCSMDRALSLNFGRSPNIPTFDISTTHPTTPGPSDGLAATPTLITLTSIWFSLSKIQSEIYEKLYSANGELERPEVRSQIATRLAGELVGLRERCQVDSTSMLEITKDLLLDSEITILTNLTLVYRQLVDTKPKPVHPLRFPDECITTARTALHLHQTLYARCTRPTESENSVKVYSYWSILFTPFTPFIVILGTAILTSHTSKSDLSLCHQTVTSLTEMAVRAPGAQKLARICAGLLRGAEKCIANLYLSSTPPTPIPSPSPDHPMEMAGADNWADLDLENPDTMFQLFDNYLAGNASMMAFLEQDIFEP